MYKGKHPSNAKSKQNIIKPRATDTGSIDDDVYFIFNHIHKRSRASLKTYIRLTSPLYVSMIS